jgi:hypothetical protein
VTPDAYTPGIAYSRRYLYEFPQLQSGIRQLLLAAGIGENSGDDLFIYGSFVRALLTPTDMFGDVDLATTSPAARSRLQFLLQRPIRWSDPRSNVVRMVRCEVNTAWFRDVEVLLRSLGEFTVSGIVYSLQDNSVWLHPNAMEHLATRMLRCPSPWETILPLKSLCRTFRYTNRGFRMTQADLAVLYRAYRGRPWWRRWAERVFVRRHFGRRLVSS